MSHQCTVEKTLILRVWREPHDAELRGRLVTTDSGESVSFRSIEEGLDAVRSALQLEGRN